MDPQRLFIGGELHFEVGEPNRRPDELLAEKNGEVAVQVDSVEDRLRDEAPGEREKLDVVGVDSAARFGTRSGVKSAYSGLKRLRISAVNQSRRIPPKSMLGSSTKVAEISPR